MGVLPAGFNFLWGWYNISGLWFGCFMVFGCGCFSLFVGCGSGAFWVVAGLFLVGVGLVVWVVVIWLVFWGGFACGFRLFVDLVWYRFEV